MKGFDILYKKMKRYFQKIFFKNFRPNFRKNPYVHKKNVISQNKKDSKNLDESFEKN